MIVAIHQLHYLPWLRYFHKMAGCDTFVVLDDIQFNKNGWQNRNKIKGPAGAQLLTVPIRHKWGRRLDEVQIENKTPWRRKHWQSLVTCYGKAPFFSVHADTIKAAYEKDWQSLNELNAALLRILVKQLGIRTRIVYSSSLGIKTEATHRLVDICKAMGANAYLTGEYAAQMYLEPELFKAAGVELLYQKYEALVYHQQFDRSGLIPDLSIVDLLFNHGAESLDILLGKLKIHDDSSFQTNTR